MRNILNTLTDLTVTGARQDRLVVVGTVDVRGANRLCMRDFYQHALQAMARLLTALACHFKPATALATGLPLATAEASSGSQATAAPCWQRKPAGQHPSAPRS